MKFHTHIPMDLIEPTGEFQTGQAVSEMARAVEAAGIAAAYVTDHPAPSADWLHNDPTGHDALDPFTALAFIAAATTRLKVMTQVLVLPYRNPFLTAKAAATLQTLSGGRFVMGVGVGYQKIEFEALGVAFNQRGALTDEALETIRLAWAGGAVIKEGRHFNAVGNEPRPIPKRAPPIWIGGGSDKAVERAALWGEGWTPFLSLPTDNEYVKASWVKDTADLGRKIEHITARRAELGRSGAFDISTASPVPLQALSASEAERFLESVQQLAQLGVTWVAADLPAPSRGAYIDNLRWFGETIIPRCS